MKVLLINGSPHKEGCTFTALSEVANTLNKNGINRPEYEPVEFTSFPDGK